MSDDTTASRTQVVMQLVMGLIQSAPTKELAQEAATAAIIIGTIGLTQLQGRSAAAATLMAAADKVEQPGPVVNLAELH